jgi:hypothetical protein
MKAMLKGHLIAESDDIIGCGGYHYFPSSAVRMSGWKRRRGRNRIAPAHMASSSTMW